MLPVPTLPLNTAEIKHASRYLHYLSYLLYIKIFRVHNIKHIIRFWEMLFYRATFYWVSAVSGCRKINSIINCSSVIWLIWRNILDSEVELHILSCNHVGPESVRKSRATPIETNCLKSIVWLDGRGEIV